MKCTVSSTLLHSSEKASPQCIIFDRTALLSISNRNPTLAKKSKKIWTVTTVKQQFIFISINNHQPHLLLSIICLRRLLCCHDNVTWHKPSVQIRLELTCSGNGFRIPHQEDLHKNIWDAFPSLTRVLWSGTISYWIQSAMIEIFGIWRPASQLQSIRNRKMHKAVRPAMLFGSEAVAQRRIEDNRPDGRLDTVLWASLETSEKRKQRIGADREGWFGVVTPEGKG